MAILRNSLFITVLFMAPAGVWCDGVDMSGRLGLSALEFDYEETDQGVLLSREEGPLPGVNAGLVIQRGAWFAETGLSWWLGRVDYSAAGIATETDESILDLDVIGGRQLLAAGKNTASLYAGVGYRDWQRDIRSTPTVTGLNENYTWWYGLVGVRVTHRAGRDLVLTGDVQLTRTASPRIEVDFLSVYDPAKLDLGEETGYRVSATLERRLADDVALWISPWFEYWRLGRSASQPLFQNGNPANRSLFEPRSLTRNVGINLGVTWRFGARPAQSAR